MSAGGTVNKNIRRHPKELYRAFTEVSVAVISDCLQRFSVCSPLIQPLNREDAVFCGPAVTVEEIEGGNLMSHLALENLQAGDVLVIDGKGIDSRACFGGIQAAMARLRGVAAILVDGRVRDYDELARLGVPVFARGASAAGPHKGWGGFVNRQVSFGGVPVNPGDLVVGDRDGIVVIPFDLAEGILAESKQRTVLENEWRDRVARGESTASILGFHEKAKELKIEFC